MCLGAREGVQTISMKTEFQAYGWKANLSVSLRFDQDCDKVVFDSPLMGSSKASTKEWRSGEYNKIKEYLFDNYVCCF